MLLAIAAAATLTVATSSVHAGQATAPFMVSVRVPGICIGISAQSISFPYDPVVANAAAGTDQYATGRITMTCLVGTVVDVYMSFSGNTVAGQRRLVSGLNALNYSLYPPASGSPGSACNTSPPAAQWKNNGTGTPGIDFLRSTPFTGFIGSTRTFNYCVYLPRGQNVPVGNYTDSITATVNF
jgi:spore coat protein U-like protein